MDKIVVVGLRAECVLGVYAFERTKQQPVVLDISVSCDIQKASQHDCIEAVSINYQTLSEHLVSFISSTSFFLLETLAEHVALSVYQNFSVSWLQLTLYKPQAVPEADRVGISLERSYV